jgi:predicted TIM-barrel fold metal-dependent hydrolase
MGTGTAAAGDGDETNRGTGGVVDSHVHLLPGRLAAKVRDFFQLGGPVDFAYPLDHGEVAARIASEGVAAVWTLPYSHKPGVAPWLNEQAATTASQVREVEVVAGATVHPADVDPVGIVRAAVEDGGARVLKLHCSVGDFDATDARLAPVWEYVEAVALPVVVHAGHSVLGTTDAPELVPIGEVARRHPGAPIVIAHCGHRAVAEAIELVRALPNVHADLTPVMHEHVAVPAADAAALHAKLLFGTDTPNTPLTTSSCLDHVDGLGLDAEARAAIVGGNARRLVAAVRS